MAYLTGEDANIQIGASFTHETVFGMSDFSLTFDRGTVEQELVGSAGNYFTQGALSVEGSLTNCRFAASGQSEFLDSIINGTVVKISGQIDSSSSLNFFLKSCQVTGYDISIGDASTITEASIDFTVMDPGIITYASQYITDEG